jgi:hypothetical protein
LISLGAVLRRRFLPMQQLVDFIGHGSLPNGVVQFLHPYAEHRPSTAPAVGKRRTALDAMRWEHTKLTKLHTHEAF